MFPSHVTSLDMFLIEHRFHFGLLLVHIPMLPSLLSFVLCVFILSLHVQFLLSLHLCSPVSIPHVSLTFQLVVTSTILCVGPTRI